MKYTKPPLTFEQQADQLLQRGLVAERAQLIETLSRVSYYRLSAYWRPFRKADESLKPGTTLEIIWRRYVFDRQLRLLVMDAIERAEIAILRTLMVEQHARRHGAFGYCDPRSFRPDFLPADHQRMLDEMAAATQRSREAFVDHFRQKYTSEPCLPLWMAAEVVSFGTLLTFFRNLHFQEQKTLAAMLGLRGAVLKSWLLTLNYVRNLCAHHGRLWNRELSIRPLIPDRDSQWMNPAPVGNERVYAVLTLLRYLLKLIAPQSAWGERLRNLLAAYPDVPRAEMGFPANWETSPIWQPLAGAPPTPPSP